MNTTPRPDWYDRLARGPAEFVSADPVQMRRIILASRRSAIRRRRIALASAGAALLLLLLAGVSYYAWTRVQQHEIAQATVPGTSEQSSLLRAIEKERDYAPGQIQLQYIEPWHDGVLAFYQRFVGENKYDIMSVQYMRLTWQGWKWIYGGGMGGSYTEPQSYLFDAYLPDADPYLHTSTPFPIVFGTLTGDAQSVRVEGPNGFKAQATVFPSDGQLGWFAYMPSGDEGQYVLTAYDAQGNRVASKTLDAASYKPGADHAEGSASSTAS